MKMWLFRIRMRARILWLRTRQTISGWFYMTPTEKEYEALRIVPFPLDLPFPIPFPIPDFGKEGAAPVSQAEMTKPSRAALRRHGSLSDPVFWVIPDAIRAKVGMMGAAGVLMMIPIMLLSEILATPYMVYMMLRAAVTESIRDGRELMAWLRQPSEKS